MRNHSILTSCALAALLLAACNGSKKGGSSTGGTTGDHVLGGPTSLQITTAPVASLVAGQTFGLTVQVIDDGGEVYTGTPLQLHIAGQGIGGSGTPTLTGDTNVTTSNGVATFQDIGITLAGNFNIVCTVLGTSGIDPVGAPLNVRPGQATQLVFSVQPADQLPNSLFNPSVVLAFADAYKNTDPNTNDQVTLTLNSNPNASATLSGSTPQTTASGLTTFATLQIDTLATGFTLHATGHGFTVDSNPFNVRDASWATLTQNAGLSDIAWSGQTADGTTLVVSGPATTAISADNGNTFTAKTAPSDNAFRDLLLAPDSAAVIYGNAAASGAGAAPIQRSSDTGTSWTALTGSQRLVTAKNSTTLFAAGTAGQAGGPLAKSVDSGASFTQVLNKTVLAADIYRAAPGALYAADANYLYQSADDGATWGSPVALPASGGWVALKADQDTAGRLYIYGTEGLWRSNDSGGSWTQLLFIGVNDVAVSSDPNRIYAIANNTSTSAIAVVGTTNAGNSWSNAGWGLPTNNGGCTAHLTVSHSDPNTVFLSISSTGTCYKTVTNPGATTPTPVNSGLYRTVIGGF